jgi:hypothetical protein
VLSLPPVNERTRRLVSRRFIQAHATVQVHPATLPLLIDLAFAVVLTAGLEREQVRIPREHLKGCKDSLLLLRELAIDEDEACLTDMVASPDEPA